MTSASDTLISRKRIVVCFLMLFLASAAIVVRLIFLQFIDAKKLILRSDRQSLYIEKLSPYRGRILDRNGNE
ncbi:MAG: hypothetical protein KC649_06080, partial [Candidatus Omnitrophica bacterium]|nr:hypothetical protein [Candidatus Omnitrophota bacterium]